MFHRESCNSSFIRSSYTRDVLFTFLGHCHIVRSYELWWRLIGIDIQLIRDIVFEGKINDFKKISWSNLVPNRSCNNRPWGRHSSTCIIHSLVKWSSPWSCHFELKILSVFDWFCPNPLSAPRTTWILVPAPATCRLTSIERTFVSSSSSKYNGLPLGFPIFAVSACAVGLSFFYSLIDFW